MQLRIVAELNPRIEFILILDHREMDRFNIRFVPFDSTSNSSGFCMVDGDIN